MGALIGLGLFILVCYLYYLLMRAFFVHVAPDTVFLGSLLLSFVVPYYYVKACWKVFWRNGFSAPALVLASYLIVSMHLNFLGMAVFLCLPHVSAQMVTLPGVAEGLTGLFANLPDQYAIGLLLDRVRRIVPVDPYLEYHLLSLLAKSLCMGPLLLLAGGMPRRLVPGSSQPAFTQYFFHGAFRELQQVVGLFAERARWCLQEALHLVKRLFTNIMMLLTWPLGIVGIAVLLVPMVLAGLVLLAMLLCHALTIAYVVLVTFLTALILRLIEHLVSWIRWGFAKCPHCYKRVAMPVFQCPACGRKHTRLVPGRFGLLLRRCRCDQAFLPTLFMLGKGRKLSSYCPHCDRPLTVGAFARNIHIPMVGGPTAGKTSLLAACLEELLAGAANPLQADFVTLEDRRSFDDVWHPNFQAGVASAKTVDLAPPALLLTAGLGRTGASTLYLYDPAGEVYEATDPLTRHGHLQYADGAVLLVDPFSLESVRERHGEALAAADFDYSRLEPSAVYEQLVRVLVSRAGLRRDKKVGLPLAVVLPKIDACGLHGQLGIRSRRRDYRDWSAAGAADADRVRSWLREQDPHFVRMLEGQFANVRYFAISAFGLDHRSGTPFRPSRVLQPLLWLLARRRKSLRPVSTVVMRLSQAVLAIALAGLMLAAPVLGVRVAADSVLSDQETVMAAFRAAPGLPEIHARRAADRAAAAVKSEMPRIRVRVRSARVRAAPSTRARSLGTLKQGAVVYQAGRQGEWIRIKTRDGSPAWIREDLLEGVAPAAGETVATGPRLRVRVRSARLRSRPTTGSSVVAGLPQGTVVTKLAEQGAWYRIRTREGKMGWLRQDLVAPAP